MGNHNEPVEPELETLSSTDDDVPPLEYIPRLKRFLHHDMVASGLLLSAAVAALLVVNLGGEAWYHNLWEFHFGFALEDRDIEQTLHHWVNDGLMAIFFFVVGLEIKRELMAGELASVRRAILPAAAALGGMVFPALIYTLFNLGGEGAHGWGIPMATDIAFAAGCLALMKRWVNPSLMVFLVALAIVDDLGAVAVIALFYTDTIDFAPLILGGTLIVISFILNQLGVRVMWPYALVGIVIWVAFLESGIHATIAGVLLAFSIPHTARYRTHNFTKRMKELLGRFDHAEQYWEREESKEIHKVMVNARQQSLLRSMGGEIIHVEAPLQRLEHNLEPLVAFIILPIFAFANAGVHLEWSHIGGMLLEPVTLGVMAGLVIGKPLGVLLSSWLTVRAGLAELPQGIRWPQILGVGMLAGIGFTMSLFINGLAFTGSEAETLMTEGKVGIFLASIIAAVIGLILIRLTCREEQPTPTVSH